MTKDKKIIWIILFAAAIFIYFFGLNIPLLGPDEPRYAQVAREMFERHDWITPTLGGTNWFEKPALLYWLQIVAYKIFGVSELAARFGSAIFGLLTVLSLWILGKNVTSENENVLIAPESSIIENPKPKTQNPKFSNWLALTAASSLGLVTFSHGASFDIIITFPITASLVSFFIFDIKQRRNNAVTPDKSAAKSDFLTSTGYLFLFYFFIGVALLAKGLIGIVFPLAIVIFYYVLSRKFPPKAFIFSLFWGTIVSLLVAGIWYLPMYERNGWTFIDEFFIQHHFARFTSNKYQHPQPFWFFWIVLPLLTLPWLPFFLAAIWTLVRNAKSAVNNPLTALALAWMLVPLVFFSLSGSKLPGYILPSLPAALILTTQYVWQFVQKSRRREIIMQIVSFAMFAVIFALLQFMVVKYAPHETVKNLLAVANAEGYTTEKIINMHTISHNAEFYAENRLVRDTDGKLRKFYGVMETVIELRRENIQSALVLVPLEYEKDLTSTNLLTTKVLSDNGELAIVAVQLKENQP